LVPWGAYDIKVVALDGNLDQLLIGVDDEVARIENEPHVFATGSERAKVDATPSSWLPARRRRIFAASPVAAATIASPHVERSAGGGGAGSRP
jgi:hypothetical protein